MFYGRVSRFTFPKLRLSTMRAMRTTTRLLVCVLALGLVAVGTSAATVTKAPFRASLAAQTHTPTVNARWGYVVSAKTFSGRPLMIGVSYGWRRRSAITCPATPVASWTAATVARAWRGAMPHRRAVRARLNTPPSGIYAGSRTWTGSGPVHGPSEPSSFPRPASRGPACTG